MCRRKSALATSLIVKRRNWHSVQQSLQNLSHDVLQQSAEELKNGGFPTNPNIRHLIGCISSIGGLVPLSNEMRNEMRRNLKGMIECTVQFQLKVNFIM